MNLLPRVKMCPCCEAINLIKVNGVSFDNEFQSLNEWILKKKINCRKCKVELGLFATNHSKEEKLIWMDVMRCEETYLKKLVKLQKNKEKYKEKNNEKEYLKILKQIQNIQNQIRLDQIQVKIKAKIQNKGMSI